MNSKKGKNSNSNKKKSLGKKTNSGGLKKSQRKKPIERPEYVGFDPVNRLDFITGFHKRKVEQKKQAKERALEYAKQEKREFRQMKRKRVGAALKELDRIEAIANGTWRPTDAEEDSEENDTLVEKTDSLDKSSFSIQSDKSITTVTVSEFDPSAL